MSPFRILSLNVRGLRNDVKRRGIMTYCRERADIVCLQETHSSQDKEVIWNSEWGNKCYYSHGESNARGVMTLLQKGTNLKVVNIVSDEEGRLLILEINQEGNIFVIANIYGPNRDSVLLFNNLSGKLEHMSEHKIIIGDFNTTLQDIDRYGKQKEIKHNAQQAIKQLIEDYLLEDVWRSRNEQTLHFSWNRRKPHRQASRIDYALVSRGLLGFTQNATYIPAANTDHRAFFMAIDFQYKQRGKGYWKLNCSMLQNIHFVNKINTVIEDIINQHIRAHPCTVWENIKANVAKEAKNFCKKEKTEKKLIMSQLLEAIDDIEWREDDLTEQEENILLQSKAELETLTDEYAKQTIFRSKVRWIEQGEKSTKYFFNLEKSRYNAKTCQVLLHESEMISDDTKILELQKTFYQNLYARDEKVKFQLQNVYGITVSKEQQTIQNMEISEIEIGKAIKELKNNKTPGTDGLPIEFYKMFYPKIKKILLNLYISGYEESSLNSSAMKGILNLIPKPGRDPRDINNLRPITLLNVDYKIIEKVLAMRMEQAMHDIIHVDQKGFLKGRRISSNIRKILDIIFQADEKKLNAIILSLDYRKCFDMISFDAIIGALEFFHFPPYIVEWTKTLYTDYTVKIQNNGYFSEDIYREICSPRRSKFCKLLLVGGRNIGISIER